MFFLVIAIDYKRGQKTNLAATKWFSCMMIFTGVYLVFDIATVYTIINMKESFLNRLCHQIFIGSLDCIIFSLAIYVEMIGHLYRKIKMKYVVMWSLPFAISMIVVLFGKLTYVVNDKGIYSYGSMAYTVYFSVIFYLAVIFIQTFRYSGVIPQKKRFALRLGILVWLTSALIQFFTSYLLISSLGVVIEILIIYLSFENPNDNIDEATGAFNHKALNATAIEMTKVGMSFDMADIVISDLSLISSNFGQAASEKILSELRIFTKNLFHTRCYRFSENSISFFIDEDCENPDKKLKILAERLTETWSVNNTSIKLAAKINIASCPESADTADELFAVLRYMAGSPSGSGIICRADMALVEQKLRNEKIEALVSEAIANDGFDVVYQPIYSTEKRKFLSAEALVRLKNTKDLGFVSPEIFIPLAEKNGSIMQLGEIVFRKVCEFSQRKKLCDLGIEYIEINLSGIQSIDAGLPRQLAEIMEKYEIKPSFINLEITETAAVESGEMLRVNMKKLRDMGCSFSMDDFGTGFSNLSQMAEVAYDLVKLDKSLIWPCFEKEYNLNANCILENVVVMLRTLNIHIVAEGVETQAMVDKLSQLRVDYLQGYYFSKPISEDSFFEFLMAEKEKISL